MLVTTGVHAPAQHTSRNVSSQLLSRAGNPGGTTKRNGQSQRQRPYLWLKSRHTELADTNGQEPVALFGGSGSRMMPKYVLEEASTVNEKRPDSGSTTSVTHQPYWLAHRTPR